MMPPGSKSLSAPETGTWARSQAKGFGFSTPQGETRLTKVGLTALGQKHSATTSTAAWLEVTLQPTGRTAEPRGPSSALAGRKRLLTLFAGACSSHWRANYDSFAKKFSP